VTFKDGATLLAIVPLDASGHAAFSTSALSIGSHTVTAEVNGTNGWLNSNGSVTQVVQDAPLVLTEQDSARVLALDLAIQTREPFTLTNPFNMSPDLRRRVSLFVWRLGLLAGDDMYNLAVEYIGALPGVADVTQVVVRLPDNVVGAPRDLSLRITVHGPASNQGIIGIAAN
jgi:hypothetical protein